MIHTNWISWGIELIYFSYNLFCVFNVVFDQIWDILHLHEKRWNLIKCHKTVSQVSSAHVSLMEREAKEEGPNL